MRALVIRQLRVMLDGLGRVPERRFVAWVLVIALAMRLAWILAFAPWPISDFAYYYDHAVTLAQGGGYSTNGEPTALWPVGYPAFLGLLFWVFGPSLVAVEVANVVLSLLTLACFYRFATAVTSSRAAARLACVLVAVLPSQLGYCSLASDSVLFGFLLWLGASIVAVPSLHPIRAIIAGSVFGAATLVRPYALLLPVVFTMGGWRQRGPTRWMLSLVLAFSALLAMVLPWTLRNERELGAPVFVSTNGGINLYIGHNPQANGGYMEPPQLDISRDEVERDRLARAAALDHIRAHPLNALALVPRKLFHLYADDSESLRWNIRGIRGTREVDSSGYRGIELAGMVLFNGLYYLLLLMAIVYVAFARRRDPVVVDRRPLWLIAYFSAIAAVFFGSSRFHFPITPALSIYAAASIYALARDKSEECAS